MPVGIIYPLELPAPARPTSLVCTPHARTSTDAGVIVVDENQVGTEERNRLLEVNLGRRSTAPLWLITPAPRAAERAYWAHLLADPTSGPVKPLVLEPPRHHAEWWRLYELDREAMAAIERRR